MYHDDILVGSDSTYRATDAIYVNTREGAMIILDGGVMEQI